ncbi:serine hydrolase domain-containing protein [Streptomyces sp. RFCAC02]|uniref:serine hydrolase domain-containing protein n=1 Tax=Streptomyces sp. RFCAC02 TaxID=2499143 RepID=UPI0019D02886|nr:serine hydrolase domain-containing protein [Streptomyces sp. RFCAC02]
MRTRTSRRSVLGALGAAPAAAFVAGAFAPAVAQESAGTVPAGLRPGGELDQLVAGMAEREEFAGSLLVTHRSRTVLERSHGMADRQRGVPNGPGTAFPLASVTKLFTAVAVAQLAQQGLLTYSARLGTFLDGFPSAVADKVSVHHLLTHTSGYGDYRAEPGFPEAEKSWTTREETMEGITEFIRRSEPAFAPGAGGLYSNAGYHLLGAIVEKVSGVSYYDYVQEKVFGAAGMTSSRFLTKPEWRASRAFAHPYHRDEQGEWADSLELFANAVGTPAGDAFSTCADMARFARALWEGRLLDAGTTALLLSGKAPLGAGAGNGDGSAPQESFQCYGPVGMLIGGRWKFEHGGGNTLGMSTMVQLYPDADWTVSVLSNYGDAPSVQSIAVRARDMITG